MSREEISKEGKRFYREPYKPTDPIYKEGCNVVIRGNSFGKKGPKKGKER